MGYIPLNAEIPTGEANSVLAVLYRGILTSLNISEQNLEGYITRYIETYQPDFQGSITTRARYILTELLKPSLMWNYFCEGLRIIGIIAIEVDLTLHHESRNVTDHHINLDLTIQKPDDKIKNQLSLFYQKILFELNVTADKFNRFLIEYLNDPINDIPNTSKDRSEARGNIKKSLLPKPGKESKHYMTWKSFCKGLNLLKIQKFTIKLTPKTEFEALLTYQKTIYIRRK